MKFGFLAEQTTTTDGSTGTLDVGLTRFLRNRVIILTTPIM